MLIGLLYLLLYAVVIAIVVYLALWVLDSIGLVIPERIKQLIYVAAVIVVVILVVRYIMTIGALPF